jgi:hypothetical protein
MVRQDELLSFQPSTVHALFHCVVLVIGLILNWLVCRSEYKPAHIEADLGEQVLTARFVWNSPFSPEQITTALFG